MGEVIMRRHWLPILLCTGTLIGAYNASGERARPETQSALKSVTQTKEFAVEARPKRLATNRSPQHLPRERDILRRFRPVKKSDPVDFEEAGKVLSQTTLSEIYDEEFRRNMQREYAQRVAPWEDAVNDPFRPAHRLDVERFDQSREDMAKWTAREVLNERVKDLFRRSDRDSSAIRFVQAVKSVTSGGGEELPSKARPAASGEASAQTQAQAQSEERPATPIRVRPRLNILKGKGQLLFTNPVATTSLDVQTGAGEAMLLKINRDFQKLQLSSRVEYGIEENKLNLNLDKRITDEVSLNLSSERHTGSTRNAAGKKSNETASLLYRISF
jgi:hypothetical protein